MRLSFRFKVTAAICVGLISMVGLGAFGYLSIGELIDTGRDERRMMGIFLHVEAIRQAPSGATAGTIERLVYPSAQTSVGKTMMIHTSL